MGFIEETLSLNLKRLRKKINLNQEELAIRAGVTTQTIKNYEQGRSWPGPDSIAAIAGVFGVPETELFIPSQGWPVEQPKTISHLARELTAANDQIRSLEAKLIEMTVVFSSHAVDNGVDQAKNLNADQHAQEKANAKGIIFSHSSLQPDAQDNTAKEHDRKIGNPMPKNTPLNAHAASDTKPAGSLQAENNPNLWSRIQEEGIEDLVQALLDKPKHRNSARIRLGLPKRNNDAQVQTPKTKRKVPW